MRQTRDPTGTLCREPVSTAAPVLPVTLLTTVARHRARPGALLIHGEPRVWSIAWGPSSSPKSLRNAHRMSAQAPTRTLGTYLVLPEVQAFGWTCHALYELSDLPPEGRAPGGVRVPHSCVQAGAVRCCALPGPSVGAGWRRARQGSTSLSQQMAWAERHPHHLWFQPPR